MNKELKLLLISLGIFFLSLLILIFNAKFECNTIAYQDLNGTHTKNVCVTK